MGFTEVAHTCGWGLRTVIVLGDVSLSIREFYDNVAGDGCVKDVRDATRISRIGLRTLGTIYRRVMDINYR